MKKGKAPAWLKIGPWMQPRDDFFDNFFLYIAWGTIVVVASSCVYHFITYIVEV